MRHRWTRPLMLASVALLVGCGSTVAPTPAPMPAPGSSARGAPSGGVASQRSGGGDASSLTSLVPSDWFTAKPSPMNLMLAPNDGAAVTVRIGSDGGTVVAKGTDGTTYTLDIPAGALPIEMPITLVPTADVSGLPFDASQDHRVGVAMRPNGLEFVRPATLTIHPASPPEAGTVAALGYRANGVDAGTVPVDDGGGDLRLTVEHFSGFVAVWPIREAQWRALAREVQELQEWAYASEITTLLAWRRGVILAGANPDSVFSNADLARSFMPEYVERVLKPRFEMAGFGCTEAQAAINSWFGYWKALVLIGVADDPEFALTIGGETYTAITQLPADIIDNAEVKCLEEDYERCVANGDFFGLTRRLFALLRYVELLGRDLDPQWIDDYVSYAKRCGQWKLDVKTTFDDGEPTVPPGSISCCPASGTATRRFELQWKPGSGSGLEQVLGAKIEAKADLERMRVQFEGNLCHVSHTYPRSTEQASAKIAGLDYEYPDDPTSPNWAASGYPVSLRVSLDLGMASTHLTYRCRYLPQAISMDFPFDSGQVLRVFLADGSIGPDPKEPDLYPVSAADGWEFQSLSPFKAHFHKDGSASTAVQTATASLDLVLTHTPH
jgi:hypothetical protein